MAISASKSRRLLGNVDHVVQGHYSDQAGVAVHHGKDRAVVLAKDLDGRFLVVRRVQANESVVADIGHVGV